MPPKEPGKQERMNYAPLLRGLEEHVLDGRMNAEEFAVFAWLVLTVNPYTGIRYTNAPMIAAEMGKKVHAVQRAFRGLAAPKSDLPDGYIHYDGARGNGGGKYPVLVLKYPKAKSGRTGVRDYPEL